ncbi:hypothetical protein KGM_200590B, partial [Danaus plexippus plexippus]
HLSMELNENTFPKKATTYVAFSHDGNELLVNLGSEQVYLFDINSARRPVLVESFIIQHNHSRREEAAQEMVPPTETSGENGTIDQQVVLPDKIQHLKSVSVKCGRCGAGENSINRFKPREARGTDKFDITPTLLGALTLMQSSANASRAVQRHRNTTVMCRPRGKANEMVNSGSFCMAVDTYNMAIHEYPNCALLYSNRAAALMRRGWSGDTYAAIRDCYQAIKLDPGHVKSHFRLAKGLMDLKRAREAHECLLYFKDKFPKHASSHAVFLLQKDIKVALKTLERDEGDDDSQAGSPLERQLRMSSLDYSSRFLGHCNTTTDIKEANFLGPNAGFVAAGLLGSMFIWCRHTGNIVRCLRGDESIVNCVQLHPSMFLLATSGIEAVVRLWSPRPEDGCPDTRAVSEASAAAAANQQRMRSDPFEAMLLNISFAGGADRDVHSPACRATLMNSHLCDGEPGVCGDCK